MLRHLRERETTGRASGTPLIGPVAQIPFLELASPSEFVLGFDASGMGLIGYSGPTREDEGCSVAMHEIDLALRKASLLGWEFRLPKLTPSHATSYEELLLPMAISVHGHWLAVARALDAGAHRTVSLLLLPLPAKATTTKVRGLELVCVSQAPFTELPGVFHTAQCGFEGFATALNLGHAIRLCRWAADAVSLARCSWFRSTDKDVSVVSVQATRGATFSDTSNAKSSTGQRMLCATFEVEEFLAACLPKQLGVTLASWQNRPLQRTQHAGLVDYACEFVRFADAACTRFEVAIVAHVVHLNQAHEEAPWLLALLLDVNLRSPAFRLVLSVRFTRVVVYARGTLTSHVPRMRALVCVNAEKSQGSCGFVAAQVVEQMFGHCQAPEELRY